MHNLKLAVVVAWALSSLSNVPSSSAEPLWRKSMEFFFLFTSQRRLYLQTLASSRTSSISSRVGPKACCHGRLSYELAAMAIRSAVLWLWTLNQESHNSHGRWAWARAHDHDFHGHGCPISGSSSPLDPEWCGNGCLIWSLTVTMAAKLELKLIATITDLTSS